MAKRAGGDLLASPRGQGRVAKRSGEESATLPDTTGLSDPAPLSGKSDLVLLGEFGRAHGLKGEVRLKSFTADPTAIACYGPVQSEDGRTFSLKQVRPAGGGSPDL